MNRAKYLAAIFFGTFVYVLLSMTFGQNSLHCYNKMEEQKFIISKQTTEIQNINSELALELAALQNDRAVIASYAHKLDYVSDGEKLVKITGLRPAQTTLYDTGSVLRHEEPEFLPEKVCKIVGFGFALLFMIIFLLYDISAGNIVLGKDKKPIVTGIPVYDLPQI
ncbi:MAG: septum formation initiator family protein [Treponema sp.]|nr:septum formation initiator family protein [Treponema sp.]